MKSAHLLDQILALEAQKQNISNQAAFSVGQQIQPIDARIAELRNQLVNDNTVTEANEPRAAVAASKPKGRPKGSKNIPKLTPSPEAVAS